MATALDNLGAHLLGRTYVFDEQDWPLETFLLLEQAKRAAADGTDPLDVVLAAVMKSRASATTKAFDATVVAEIKKLRPSPVPPDPGPTPVPPAPVPDPAVTGIEYANANANQDQGQTPECVGGAWANMGNTDPIDDRWGANEFDVIYRICKQIDGDNQDGSSTRSGAQAMQQLGRIKNYAWTTDTATITAWLLAGKGSVVTGTDWYESMFAVDDQNFMRIAGQVVGGHEWLLVGVRPDLHAYVGCTSWGPFGANHDGRFLIDIDEYGAKLLSRQGDACAAVELPLAS